MSLFQPSKEQVREFFCEAWKKHQENNVLTPLESIAARWMVEHPEYHAILNDVELAKSQDFQVEDGKTNPFLHLSMHMSLSEQCQVDQPSGIKSIRNQLITRYDSEHDAHHQMMECLGEVIWESQRAGVEPDLLRYIECLKKLG